MSQKAAVAGSTEAGAHASGQIDHPEARPLLVQPVSLLDQSVSTLRAAIMTCELLPGEKLGEHDLCRRMGISRPSLREALRRLEAEHLIDIFPNRGSSVAKLGPEEVDDIQQVWTLITSEIVFQFAKRATPKQIRELEQRIVEIEAATDAGDAIGHVTATDAFFAIMIFNCGNSVFIEIVGNVMSRIHFLRARALQHERRQQTCIAELRNIDAAARTHRCKRGQVGGPPPHRRGLRRRSRNLFAAISRLVR